MEPEPITDQPQPAITPVPPVSPVVPIPKPKSRTGLFMRGILILGIGFTIGLLFNKNLSPTSQVPATPTPLLSPTPQAKPDLAPPDTTNWKTYTNTKFAYSIKYPPTLTPLETTSDIYLNQVAFNGPEKTYLSGTIVEVRNLTNLEDEISYRTWRVVGHIAEKLDSETSVSVYGLPGKRLNYTSGQKQFSTVILPYQKLVYSIEAESNLLDQILSTFTFVEQTTLVPPDFQTQAAGVCAPVSKESVIAVTIPMDNVPQPRCVHATFNQKLKIINESKGSININVGKIQATLAPTQSFQFPKTLGEFLAPGGHFIAGAEILLE